jgi:hypothetical protein
MTNRTSLVSATRSSSLADILERVLDKGVVIAGDIKIKLVEIELLTIQIRLVVCSVERAMAMGMDWWRTDPNWSMLAREQSQLPSPSEGANGPELAAPTQVNRMEQRVETEPHRAAQRDLQREPQRDSQRDSQSDALLSMNERMRQMEDTLRRLEDRLSPK